MIDVRKLKDEFDDTAAALARRGVERATLEKARDLDAKRRALLAETETLKAKRNAASKEIGKVAKEGGDVAAAKEEMRKVGDRIAEIDRELAETGRELRETLLMIPNIPAPEIPTGMDSSANVVVRKVGEWKDPDFKILDHMAVGEKLGIFDFPRGVKLTGTPLTSAISRDEGETWGGARDIEVDPGGRFCYTAIQAMDDGTLLLAYCAYDALGHTRIVKVPADWFYGR